MPRSRIHTILVSGLLVITVVLTFAPALRGTFVWDDIPLIVNNAYIQDFKYTGRNLSHRFWDVSSRSVSERLANNYYRPLVTLSLMVDHRLHGLNPRGYHLTNLLLHLAAVLLVFHLARRTLDRLLPAVVCAVVFALHPSRAEAVAWISGRADLLAAVFFLVALLLFHASLERATRRWIFVSLGWLAFGLALVSKESSVTLGLVVPMLDWLLVSRGDRHRFLCNLRRVHLPLLVATAVIVAVRLMVGTSQVELGIGPRAALVLQSLGHYAHRVVAPYHPSMLIGVEFDPLSPSWGFLVLGACATLLVAGGVWIAARRGNWTVAFGLLFLVVTLAPASNIVPLGLRVMVAERFLYLPLVGLGLVIGWAFIRRSAAQPRGQGLVLLGVVVLVSSWAVTTHARCEDFSDVERLWRGEVAQNPNPVAMYFLGQALAEKRAYDGAEHWLGRAFFAWSATGRERQWPMLALLNLLDVRLIRIDDWDTGFLERVARFLSTLLPPVGRSATIEIPGRGVFVVKIDSAAARRAVIDLRARVLGLLGAVQSRLGQDGAAEASLSRALRLDPRQVETLVNLGLVRLRARDLDGAMRAVQRAREMLPGDPAVRTMEAVVRRAAPRIQTLRRLDARQSPHMLRAELFLVTRSPRRACDELRRQIARDPRQPPAHTMLAMELASAGRQAEALEVVRAARKIFGDIGPLHRLEQEVRAHDR